MLANKMKNLLISILITLFPFAAVFSDDESKFKELLGYTNVTVTKVEPDGIRIIHESGAAKIPIEKIPEELRSKFGINENGAQAHRQQIRENDQRRSPSGSDRNPGSSYGSGTKQQIVLLSTGGRVIIEYGNDVIYGTNPPNNSYYKNSKIHISDFYHVLKLHADQVAGNTLVQSAGKSYRTEFKSLTPKTATISKKGRISWIQPGGARFEVKLFDPQNNAVQGEATINVKVVLIPVTSGVKEDKVVETLGFPDSKTSKYFEWHSKSGTFEGIWYSFETDGHGETVNHFSYNKYPGLKLHLNILKNLSSARTIGWHSSYGIGVVSGLDD